MNSDRFLKPLTIEEERYYLKLLKAGSQSAKNILIERNLNLVAHIVRKYIYLNSDYDIDNLISIGTIGLIKGIMSFDPDNCRYNRLAPYLMHCIENEISVNIRASDTEDKITHIKVPDFNPKQHKKEWF